MSLSLAARFPRQAPKPNRPSSRTRRATAASVAAETVIGSVIAAAQPSGSSRQDRRVEPLEFDAGVGGGKAPVDGGASLIPITVPGGDLTDEGGLIGDASIETLASQHTEFELGHIQPTRMFRR